VAHTHTHTHAHTHIHTHTQGAPQGLLGQSTVATTDPLRPQLSYSAMHRNDALGVCVCVCVCMCVCAGVQVYVCVHVSKCVSAKSCLHRCLQNLPSVVTMCRSCLTQSQPSQNRIEKNTKLCRHGN